MLVNYRHRFALLTAPRTASSSLRSWLRSLDYTWIDGEQHRFVLSPAIEDFFAATIFRHPGERGLSLWAYHQRNDADRRSLEEYARDLPTMHEFHRWGQCDWMRTCNVELRIVRAGAGLEKRLLDCLFTQRGLPAPRMPLIPLTNITHRPRWLEVPESVRMAFRQHWALDFKIWEDAALDGSVWLPGETASDLPS